MKPLKFTSVFIALLFLGFQKPPVVELEEAVAFHFQGRDYELRERVRVLAEDCWGGWCQTNDQLDTLCNVFFEAQNRIKIIRQDDGFNPDFGIGLLFEFKPTDSLPYRSESARMQFNDFRFGGLRASQTDRANYTGVTNDVSSDLKLTVESFEGGVIRGSFSGVLINGAGGMSPIENGHFSVRIYKGHY